MSVLDRLFNKKKPDPKAQRKIKRPKTVSDITRDAAVRIIRRDPRVRERLAFKELGLEPEMVSEIKQAQDELKAVVAKEAANLIRTDETLRNRLARKHVNDVLGELVEDEDGDGYEDGNRYGSHSSLDEIMDDFDRLDELRARFGGGSNSGISNILNPHNLEMILNLVTSRMVGPGPGPSVKPSLERIIIVEINGQATEITESQYRQLYSEGKVKPVAQIGPGEQRPRRPVPEPEVDDQEPPAQILIPPEETEVKELPSILQDVDFESIAYLLDLSPDEFITELLNSELAGAQILLLKLQSSNTDDVVGIITPYAGNPTVGQYVQRLLTDEGKVWITDSISYLQELMLNG